MKKLLLVLSLVVVAATSLTGCGPTPEEVQKQQQAAEDKKKQQQAAEDKKALGGEFKPSEGKKY